MYRFPNSLCTDKGRAINQQEAGWENTLTGIPKEIFELWRDYLKPRGYRISYQILTTPEVSLATSPLLSPGETRNGWWSLF